MTMDEIEEREQIIQAMAVIKKVCEENIDCEACPFYSTNKKDCRLMYSDETPRDWSINENNTAWRALL